MPCVTARRARPSQHCWVKVGTFETRQDGDRRICVTCGTVVRGYQYRVHPPESGFFERCLGLAWCSGCRVYAGTMVYVRRDEQLVDALAGLPTERRERLGRSELALVEFLDTWARGEE
jgi:hypothetical protein